MSLRQLVLVFSLVLISSSNGLRSAESEPIADAEFGALHKMLKPQAGESRWMEIDWYANVWEARQRAAREGKPIFLMAGSGGAPVAGC